MVSGRTAILAVAFVAATVLQAQAATRVDTLAHLCRAHYEYAPLTNPRPQTGNEIAVYFIDATCQKRLVRVIRNPQKRLQTKLS